MMIFEGILVMILIVLFSPIGVAMLVFLMSAPIQIEPMTFQKALIEKSTAKWDTSFVEGLE